MQGRLRICIPFPPCDVNGDDDYRLPWRPPLRFLPRPFLRAISEYPLSQIVQFGSVLLGPWRGSQAVVPTLRDDDCTSELSLYVLTDKQMVEEDGAGTIALSLTVTIIRV